MRACHLTAMLLPPLPSDPPPPASDGGCATKSHDASDGSRELAKVGGTDGHPNRAGCGEGGATGNGVEGHADRARERTGGAVPLPVPVTPNGLEFGAIPHISVLLYQEAEAWRTLMQLHNGLAGATRELLATMQTSSDRIEQTVEDTQSREATYCASLSSLASQCDMLAADALRLRTLRKSRVDTEKHVLQLLTHAHTHETLSVGNSMAAQASLGVQVLMSELRQLSSATRTQIAQLRTAMQLLRESSHIHGDLCVGVRRPTSSADNTVELQFASVQDVYATAYEQYNEASEEALVTSLTRLGLIAPVAHSTEGPTPASVCHSTVVVGENVPSNVVGRTRTLVRRSSTSAFR